MHLYVSNLVSLLWIIGYGISVIVSIIIISQNRNPSKTLAYLLLFFSLPFLGIIIYVLFGENFRKNKMYKKKYLEDNKNAKRYEELMVRFSEEILRLELKNIDANEQIIRMLLSDAKFPLTIENNVKVLRNGEEKFEALFAALRAAKHHIHMEYYIFKKGVVAQKLKEILIAKAQEGVQIRIVYDDFGTKIPNKYWKELRSYGIESFPFHKIYFPVLSNRHNYRDHRKLVVIDGNVGFTGGINIADNYDNRLLQKNKMYWRDTHLQIKGDAVKQLQYLFFLSWNFCSHNELPVNREYFPLHSHEGNQIVQVTYSGPDSERASIMLSYFAAICNAQNYIYITTPYFIPNESILNALKKAALSKVDVRMIVPSISDTIMVNAAAKSYYEELLECGVRIYMYQKGFVHVKTMIVDDYLSMVGSANMDIRSFDLNFEMNAVIYDAETHHALKEQFLNDMEHSTEIVLSLWQKRGRFKKLGESFARLFSSVL
jgi:cardiolipin synthase